MEEQMIIPSDVIKAEAERLGFSACGIVAARAVDEATAQAYRSWLQRGGQAEMHYMENHLDKRLDPRLLMPGLRTIVSVAMNYAPARQLPSESYQLAAYALGKDYHDIVRQRLHQLAQAILSGIGSQQATTYRAFSDSAPVLERYWAVQAGLGWIGRNRQLIIPPSANGGGSMFFLGELFLALECDHYDSPIDSRCGHCRRCVEACPTNALSFPSSDSDVLHDACPSFHTEKCLSYQTIENRGDIPEPLADKMGTTIYGCDRCQMACPWNRFANPTAEPLLHPSDELLAMTRSKWHQLTPDDYRRLFKGSAVKRAKYEGLMRNIHAVSSLQKRAESPTDGA